MKRAVRRFYVVTALLLGVAALVTLSLIQPVVGTRTDFSIYNVRWNGASGLAAALYRSDSLLPAFSVSLEEDEVSIAHTSFADFDLDPAASSVVLLRPSSPPTPQEAAWLRAFVEGGGRVLLADDFGAGNLFLEAMGARARFDGAPLMDLAYAKRPEFVVATDLEPHVVTNGAREAVLDAPTALRLPPDALVLARSSPSAWLDRDGDRLPRPDDERGPFPWIAMERVGRGDVLLLSDPSVLINGMAGVGDDRRLRDGAIAWLTQEGRRVLIDESHHDYPDPVKLTGATLRAMPTGLRAGLAVLAATLFLLLVARAPRALPLRGWAGRLAGRLLPPPPPPERDLVAQVLARHPDWDENALRGMLTARGKT